MPGSQHTAGDESTTISMVARLRESARLIAGLRRHDLRAAGTFVASMAPAAGWLARRAYFVQWATRQTFGVIPNALVEVSFVRPVSRVPVWLAEDNPFANHPWQAQPHAELPPAADVVVIGAGFTGAACAYHWSKQAIPLPPGLQGTSQRQGTAAGSLVVLEMNDPAGGASGSCEGLVVMGRYFGLVRHTVSAHLRRARSDLSAAQRDRLASQFAAAYVRSAYKNAHLIEQTIRAEGYECGYVRHGWIQAQDREDQAALDESVRLGQAAGFDDWTKIEPDEALGRGGMRLDCTAGFSKSTAHFHPARWIWCLLRTALSPCKDEGEHGGSPLPQMPGVGLFTRTRVLTVEDMGDGYLVNTTRGAIRARFVVNATESYTGLLHRSCRDLIYPVQTQAAFAEGGAQAMRPGFGYSCKRGFFGRTSHTQGVIFGSDATRLRYDQAGRNRPSRFLTKFVIGEMNRYFGRAALHVTREWSATAGFTADEFPVVGLLDGKRQYIIGGMCGSGTGVSFNAARHVVQQILGLPGPDDYPASYFSPTRLLAPESHPWPAVEGE
jgi:glycine/D-amino acid oxidase-like deaminating enzyme